MEEKNFAMQLVEKQLQRSERHFYAVCFLFLVFIFFAYLYPVSNDVDTSQEVNANDNVTISNEVK